jgi:hypothetical protein
MEFKTKTQKVTKIYVTFTQNDREFELNKVISLLESLMGTDGAVTGVRNL